MIKVNSWVKIHKIILKSEERSNNLPSDTKNVPLEMWLKGYLLNEGNIGDIVKIKTIAGRIEEGTLVDVNPSYKHNFGDFVPEILVIDQMVKHTLFGDEYD